MHAVIDLSHTLGLTTVAEGVETADTAAVLTRFGCDVVHGHHYSPPLTTDDLLQCGMPTRIAHGPKYAVPSVHQHHAEGRAFPR